MIYTDKSLENGSQVAFGSYDRKKLIRNLLLAFVISLCYLTGKHFQYREKIFAATQQTMVSKPGGALVAKSDHSK